MFGSLTGMIITSLARTFHAAFEESSAFCTKPICGAPRNARGWPSSGHAGAIASLHGWLARYWRWSITIRSTVRPNFSVR